MSKVIALPTAYMPPQALAKDGRSFITQLDVALMQLGDLGLEEGELRSWNNDRPLTASECAVALAWFNEAPEADVARRSGILRDYCTQLLCQHVGFHACAVALLARDVKRLTGPEMLGNGYAECRRLLDVSAQLMAPDGLTSPEARQQVRQRIEALAASFQRAASACRELADSLHAARDARDGDRMAARLADMSTREIPS